MYYEIFDSGIDERSRAPAIRRLYARWLSLRAEGGRVPFEAFDPAAQGAMADDMIVFRPRADGTLVYEHYGQAVVSRAGVDMTGQPETGVAEPLGTFLRTCNAQVATTLEPVFTLHRSALAGQVHVWERLVLPCHDAAGELRIVILAKPRKFRDDLLASLLDASLDAIVAVRLIRDEDGLARDAEFLAVNRLAAEWSNSTVEDMLRTTLLERVPDIKATGLWDAYLRVVETRTPLQMVTPWQFEDHESWLDVTCVPFEDGFTLTVSDITEKKKAEDRVRRSQAKYAKANAALKAEIRRRQALEEELSRLATRDSLTGVLTRRAVTEGLQKALLAAERYGQAVSVVAMDLDHFKEINDAFGHAGGDAVLRHATAVMTHGLREDLDLVGRLGGEEFLVVLPHIGLDDAVAIAGRMRRMLAESVVLRDDSAIVFSGSFGVATWDGRETMDRLMSRADAALYRAKAAGRNAVAADRGEGAIDVVIAAPDAALQPEEMPAFTPTTRRGTAPRRPRASQGPREKA